MAKKNIVIVLLVLAYLAISHVSGQKAGENREEGDTKKPLSNPSRETEDCVTLDFHYLISADEMHTQKIRNIEVFMDEKAFNRENLRKLFKYLSRKYSSPKHLTIDVKTNWNQLLLSTDCPPGGLSEQRQKLDKYDYYRAKFYRRDRGRIVEYFHFYPVLKTDNYEEVILKGKRVN